VFGAKRIPELGAGLGKAIRSFNKGLRGDGEGESTDAAKGTPVVDSADKK
jgi:Sec-independent protein translocase protein TatA